MAEKSGRKVAKKTSRQELTTAVDAVPLKRCGSLFDELEEMQERIMQRAYDIFASNGTRFGRDLENWLQAERELFWRPPIELEEEDSHYRLQVATPGVEPGDLDVQVTEEDILIKAENHHEDQHHMGAVRVCEFEPYKLYRSVHLPRRIDPDKVEAEYKNGMLTLIAPVAKETHSRKLEVRSA